MKQEETILYFAYGSNMLTSRLQAPGRVPSAGAVGRGILGLHRLCWTKLSKKDCSGKCHVVFTGDPADVVHGVVFVVPASEKAQLDRVEGVGNGYAEKGVSIEMESGKVSAVTYVATKVVDSLRPYTWYKALVIAGAREYSLPVEYVRTLESTDAVEDPDLARHELESKIFLPK